MKTLFYNGKIYLENKKFCNSFIVENGKFFCVGKETEKWINQCSKKIDLNSKVVIPGLMDSHCHFLMTAVNYKKPNLNLCISINQIVKVCREYISKNKGKEFYFFEGWNELNFIEEKRFLNRHDLDKISENIPVFLVKSDRHLISCNTAGLKYIGIFNRDINNEFIEKDDLNFPVGILKENATYLVREKIDNRSLKENCEYIKNLSKVANSYGLTSIFTCEHLKINNTNDIDAYFELEKLNKLTLKFNHQLWFENLELLDKFFKKIKRKTTFNKINAIKLFADGSLGSRTASLKSGYKDNKKNYGFLNYSNNKIKDDVKKINSLGFQVVVHAIGDNAIDQVINVFAQLDSTNKNRNGIIHCQIASEEILNRIKKNNILMYVQPCFLEDDILIMKNLIDSKLLKSSYAFNKIKNKKIHMSFGTDSPICSLNPWENIFYALERKTIKNELNKKTFYPNEKIDIYYAIDCYTKESAYSSFCEKEKGFIKKGYDADFAVLNHDIFNLKNNYEVIKTHAEQTYLDGKLVWFKN
ncbi:MAG: amidohydrolase [Mycoplasma sp.]|nr:amidohydrolase [Mycoplasma sp.]